MKLVAPRLVLALTACLVVSLAGCELGRKKDAPVEQAPAADPTNPIAKDTKGRPQVLQK